MKHNKVIRIRKTEDQVVNFAELIPAKVKQTFVKKSIIDAKGAIDNKMSVDDLAYVIYRAYIMGLSFGQSEEFQKMMHDSVAL